MIKPQNPQAAELKPANPRLAGILGWPVAHSLSPVIHGHWFKRAGIDGTYVRLPVQTEDLAVVLRSLPLMGFLGVNVTIPHKETVFRLIDEADASAHRMQAANTVLVMPDRRLVGLNTDGLGFLQALFQAVPAFQAEHVTAVLLGTGGAARAIAFALLELGVRGLRLVNRTQARAEILADDIYQHVGRPIEVLNWSVRGQALDGAGLLVNCTSLGMHGQPELEIDLACLPLESPVFDIVYSPLMTGLLSAAKARGHPIVNGLGMLLHQAVPGFRHWGGIAPVVDLALRDKVLAVLADGP